MPPQYPQDSSLFFQKLPPELRLDIYSYVFCSTRLSFGKRGTYSKARRRVTNSRLRPAPNSLSALRVCRRFNDEIGDSWLGQVLFNFEDLQVMLDKLTDLNRHTLGKLRHMRFSSEHRLGLKTEEIEEFDMYRMYRFDLVHVLKLLHGLKLDSLTVVGPATAQKSYRELDVLINHSDGWKKLYYLSKNSVMLGFGKSDMIYKNIENGHGWRAQQPSTWIQALAARDGPTASVTIYRSRDAASNGFMISDPTTRQPFADQVAEPGKESQYWAESDKALMTPGEKEKELLVVARRGNGVDYAENGTSPVMKHDIRKHWPDMTWGQIRYMGIDWHDDGLDGAFDGDDDDDDDDYDPRRDLWAPDESEIPAGTEIDEGGLPIKEDTYRHVDDYEWCYIHTVYPPN